MADVVERLDTRTTHVLVTRDADGYFAESPQVPGLAFGRATETEFRRDFQAVLKNVGVTGRVLAHLQTRAVTDDGREYLIRCAEGPQMSDRREVAARIERCLTDRAQAADMLDTETTPMGEVVFAAAVPADCLGLFMEQMYDEDDALVIAAAVAEQGLFTMTLASGERSGEGWETLKEFGWSAETTISQLLVEWSRSPAQHRVLV